MSPRAMFETQLRHHCRRCRLKLEEPVENRRSAFCCRGCYRQFFAKRCLVCEKEMERTAGHQKICGSVACRREYRDIVAHRIEGKFGAKPQCASDGASPSANPIKKIGVCGPEKTDRPWHVVAGALSDTELRLATLSVDRVTAARIDRLNREYSRGDNTTLIKRHHPPVNLVGGYRFPDAPNIDVSSTAPNIGKTACPTMVPVGQTERRSMPSQREGQ
jgi:hypothetical protein